MHVLRAHGTLAHAAVWIGSLVLVAACSGSKGIDFFAPSDETGGAATGGNSGSASGGTETGGSSGDAGTSTGGTSGDSTGGTGATDTGGTDTGGSGPQGGSDGAGMGGTSPTGGTDTGGAGPSGGTAGDPMGGTGGAGTGGGGAGGAGTGGAGTTGGGTGGAGTGGGGTGGISGAAGSGGCTPTTPSTERCDGVDNNCSGGIDEGTACPANCTGATRAGHWYIFCSFEAASGTMTRARTWMQAQDFCTMRSLSLIAIDSAEENTFVLDWVEKMSLEDQVWIGANDRDPLLLGQSNEGDWVWGTANNAIQFWEGDEDGMAVTNRYNNWATGEPNNENNEDCGALSANHDYEWDDCACANEYENFVCESTASAVGP